MRLWQSDVLPIAVTGPPAEGLDFPVRDGSSCSSCGRSDPERMGRVPLGGQPAAGCQLPDENVEPWPGEWHPIAELEEVPGPAGGGCQQVVQCSHCTKGAVR